MMELKPDDGEDDNQYTHSKCKKHRMEIDDSEEKNLVKVMKQHGFLQDNDTRLENVFNKDVSTLDIQEALLSAENLGMAKMKTFVDRRLYQPPESDLHLEFKYPIENNTAKTFASLYEVQKVTKGKLDTIKIDKNIL